jgi:hypothetical protein
MAPQTRQRTSLKEGSGPDARAIVYGKPLDIENHAAGHSNPPYVQENMLIIDDYTICCTNLFLRLSSKFKSWFYSFYR